jgi:hypothetical protein
MDKLQQFLIEVGYLWLATAIVVAVASAINYALTSSELKELRNEFKTRGMRNRSRPADDSRASEIASP